MGKDGSHTMSDEGMSDAAWRDRFVTAQDALDGATFAHYRDHMDDEAMQRYRASVADNDGHDMAPVNFNSLRRIIARLDAAERERDALRDALEFYADKSAWNQPPVQTVQSELGVAYQNKASQMQKDRGAKARAALTANHSAPVVEE